MFVLSRGGGLPQCGRKQEKLPNCVVSKNRSVRARNFGKKDGISTFYKEI